MIHATRFDCTIHLSVTIVFNDNNVWRQCLENWDDTKTPQPRMKGGSGWKDVFYDLDARYEVAEHLAYNYLVNGKTVDQLDGFAQFPRDAVSYLNVGSNTESD